MWLMFAERSPCYFESHISNRNFAMPNLYGVSFTCILPIKDNDLPTRFLPMEADSIVAEMKGNKSLGLDVFHLLFIKTFLGLA